MRIRHQWMIIPVCAALGAALGFIQEPSASRKLTQPTMSDATTMTVTEGNYRESFTAPQPITKPITDVAQALREASLFTSRLHRRYEIGRIAEQLRPEDFAALLKPTTTAPSSLQREANLLLVEFWAEKDPEAAAAFVSAPPRNWQLTKSVARGWARKDPTAALDWVMSKPANDRGELFSGLQEGCFESATPNVEAIAQAALQSFKEIDSPYSRGQPIGFFGRWAQRDPRKAEAFARALADEEQKQQALVGIFFSVTETNPQDAVTLLKSIPFADPERQQWAVTNLTAHLAATDITLARKFAESQPGGVGRAEALGSVATAMLASNPDEAFALVESVPLDDSGGLDYFYREIAESDPATALRHCAQRLDRMEPGSGPYKALQQIFEVSLISQGGQYHHPTDVGDYLASETNADRQSGLTDLLRMWMFRDSSSALNWADELPNGRAREYALTGVAQGRAQKSIPETVQWLGTLPKGNEYAAAVQGFAATAFNHDPDGALAWVRSIPDPAERQQRLLAAWSRWAESSGGMPTSRLDAERWRDTSPELTPEERQILVLPKEE